MKCFEVTNCGEQERMACTVWNGFKDNPDEMEGLKCWVLKGVYHEEKNPQAQKCRKCKYYLSQHREAGVVSSASAQVATIACSGDVNQEKVKTLEKVWDALKKGKKQLVLLDVSRVSNLYTVGMSMLVKMHNETKAAGGALVVAGAAGHVLQLIETSRLSKILHLTPDSDTAQRLLEAFARKKEEDARQAAEKPAEKAAAPQVAEPQAPTEPKKFVPCYEYWNNHNPKNATTCDECINRKKPRSRPCWMVDGDMDGVTFSFVNEDCLGCAYYEEFGVQGQR